MKLDEVFCMSTGGTRATRPSGPLQFWRSRCVEPWVSNSSCSRYSVVNGGCFSCVRATKERPCRER
eukprot:4928986-Prymnesium_polylepis.1